MSKELDRRIAEEVMGEPKPLDRPRDIVDTNRANWHWPPGVKEWQPQPFSTDLEHAMRAVDKFFADNYAHYPRVSIAMGYYPFGDEEGRFRSECFSARFFLEPVYARTLPEAICKLLLELVDSSSA